MMSADILLSRLENVRRSGAGWRADCPNGHAKARGSLAITEAEDGRVLLHCFACSDVHGILSAVGLELADLFPERIKDPSPEARQRAREAFRRSSWDAALTVLGREATVVSIAAHDLCEGNTLTPEDHDRLLLATSRIDGVREVLQWTR
jgi:hypothetical protein